MSFPLYQFELTYDILREATALQELQTIVGFFNARNGSYDSFLYTDPSDFSVSAQQFGTGTGTAAEFQLVRTYGGFIEPVQNLNGSPSIYVNGAIKTPNIDYTISPTGILTFAVAPASGAILSWTGAFYYRVRFLDDQLDFDNFMYQLWQLKKLSFQSVKL